jgi:two-component system LytT family response regulator
MSASPTLPRVLIVDDEPLARRGLREMLRAQSPGLAISEAINGDHAVRLIRDESPDVVFLDVQMPVVDGFGVIEAVGASKMPPVVFVTAHDRYAVKAFEVQAVDYLLKPVDPDRLRDAFERASRIRHSGELEQLRHALASLTSTMKRAVEPLSMPDATDNRLRIRQGGRILLIDPGQVDWLESAGNYAVLHVPGGELRHRATMAEMQALLGPGFIRIRRSTLVRSAAIRYCEPYGKGTYVVVLRDQTRLISSRFYRSELAPLLGR